jgi:uracil-DNA glycosylase
MNKILIVGQAPPAQKQDIPYSTTMLYDWLKEVGIDKDTALELFDFEAVYDKFPGYDTKGSHKVPSRQQMEDYWDRVLKEKIVNCDKIWIVGNVAFEFLISKEETNGKEVIKTIHPSKRNIDIYKKNKISILNKIQELIFD